MLQAMAAGFDLQLQPDELGLGLASAAGAAAAKLAQLEPAGEEEDGQLKPELQQQEQAAVAAAEAQQQQQQQQQQQPSPFAAASGTPVEAAGVDELSVSEQELGEPLAALLAGQVRSVEYSGGGLVLVDAPRRRRVYLPGSFNPPHQGAASGSCPVLGPGRPGVGGAAAGVPLHLRMRLRPDVDMPSYI
jgi:hypothetical protein